MQLSSSLARIAGLSCTTQVLDPTDLAYWDVNITSIRSAGAYETQFASVIFLGGPNKTLYDE